MLDIEYRNAISEILEILKYTDKELVDKIPKSLLNFWQRNKSKTYEPKLNHNKELSQMNLLPKTRAIIAMLYTQYFNELQQK